MRSSETKPPPKSTFLTGGKSGSSEKHWFGVKAIKSAGVLKSGFLVGSTISKANPPTIALTNIICPAIKFTGRESTTLSPGFKLKYAKVSFALAITASRE